MFYIRADANKEIATGHIMRCLSIALELKKRNIDTTFITADYQADEFILARGFQTICLDSEWNNLNSEIDKMEVLIKEKSIKRLLVDSYFITNEYLENLSRKTKIIYIDDLGEISYPVNKIINYNIYGKEIDYHKLVGSNEVKLFLGTEYAPLREEFQNITPIFRKEVKSIFISTGGTDNYNIAGTILAKIAQKEKYENIDFHVISGKMNGNFPKLMKLAEQNTNIFIHSNVQRMSEIMCQCDVAVSACGSTMYELCCCGLPIITFSFADNQKLGVKAFEKAGVAVNCGDARDGLEELVEKIEQAMEYLIKDCKLRNTMYKSAISLVDGQGVKRLVNELLSN